MASWDDVRELALALPGVEEATSRGTAVWRVGKLVVWDRPMRPRDLEELGGDAPDGAVMGARVSDEGEKRALIAAEPRFSRPSTIAGWVLYPAVLLAQQFFLRRYLRVLLE